MPKLTKLLDGNVQVTITDDEILELRVDSKCSKTAGQIVQDLLTHTLGLEEEDQYWLTDIYGALEASYDPDKRERKYIYSIKDDSELVF